MNISIFPLHVESTEIVIDDISQEIVDTYLDKLLLAPIVKNLGIVTTYCLHRYHLKGHVF